MKRLSSPLVAAAFAASLVLGAALSSVSPALASNDSYCGHGTGHTAYHQWQTNAWRNVWIDSYHSYGHRHVYLKQYQPSYYQGVPKLSGYWFEGGWIDQPCGS